MMLYLSSTGQRSRRGMILLVVLALLTLFAIVGISFVFVANSQESSARIARESETEFRPRIDPEAAFAFVMGQLLYDCNDHDSGIYSALRGHSLARNMYGWDATNNGTLQDRPFTGVGRLSFSHPSGPNQFGVNDIKLMNYTFFGGHPIRDPERVPLQYRSTPTQGLDPNNQPYVPMGAIPYTYPDHNNFFLAHIDAVTGQILVPSFHREYLFGRLDLPVTGGNPFVDHNPNWTNALGKYYTLRPTRSVHPNFPMPLDRNGDVKNLDGAPGGADSIWIDINAPVMQTPDGRKYKMLVAPLILELDSRLNLNVVGNLMGGTVPNQEHRSNQGWGPWEINPSKVLNSSADPHEWRKLFYGTTQSSQARIPGRYDTNNDPPTGGNPDRRRVPLGAPISGGDGVRGWSQVDYNGAKDDTNRAVSEKYGLPTAPSASSYFGFPDFATSNSYGSGNTGSINENTDHARIYWPYHPRAAQAPDKGNNRAFPLKDLVYLLRYNGTGSSMLGSDVARLLQNNLLEHPTDDAPTKAIKTRRRNLLTLLSADLDRPGATPYVWDSYDDNSRYQLNPPAMNQIRFTLTGNRAIPFPDPFNLRTPPVGSEFDGSWRNTLAALNVRNTTPASDGNVYGPPLLPTRQRLHLLRDLYPYPVPQNGFDRINLSDQTRRNRRGQDDPNGLTPAEELQRAINDRQRFAEDLFNILRQATGAGEGDPNTHAKRVYDTYGADSPEYRALRALAQIAVNIVDYLDNDDIITSFQWTNFTPNMGDPIREYVHGFELPRLVINETYVQFDNAKDSIDMNDKKVKADGKYNVNVWAELMNPLPDDSNVYVARRVAPFDGYNDTFARLEASDGNPIYRLLLVDPLYVDADAAEPTLNTPTHLRDPANVTGDPNWKSTDPATAPVRKKVEKWGVAADPKVVEPAPAANRFEDVTKTNKGFYVVGPEVEYLDDGNAAHISDPKFDKTILVPEMTYEVDPRAAPYQGKDNDFKPQPTLVLQRLANPTLPLQENPAQPLYNPWITIDFVEHKPNMVNDGRYYDLDGERMPIDMKERYTVVRRQPFAADLSQRRPFEIMEANMDDVPKNSFFRQNSELKTKAQLDGANQDTMLQLPFDWLVHLDRKPNSPAELMHVAGGAPHLVLQDFVQPDGMNPPRKHQHTVPWEVSNSRLYRFFEFVTVPPYGTGQTPVQMDRILGKLNLNMMWNRDVFRAVCDAQGGNVFTDTEVDTLFEALVKSRTPHATDQDAPGDFFLNNPTALRPTDANLYAAIDANLRSALGNWPATPQPSDLDRPFWSLAKGHGSSNNLFAGRVDDSGLNDTILRGGRFDLPAPAHPYQKKELLRKIFNHLTTRSNVYAVWLTIGFFEVENDTTRPVQLGAEMGKAENRHIRYRMFAIVDRTNLRAFETICSGFNKESVLGQNSNWRLGDPVRVELSGASGQTIDITDARTGRTWHVRAGTVLTYEPNTDNEETVTLFEHTMNGQTFLAARFQREHPVGCRVICRGNPGPMSRYNPRDDVEVVPFFMLID